MLETTWGLFLVLTERGRNDTLYCWPPLSLENWSDNDSYPSQDVSLMFANTSLSYAG